MVTDSRGSPYRFVIGGLTLWAHLGAGISFQAVSPVLPLISDDYGIGHTTAGLLLAVVMIVMAALGLPGGIIVVKLGLRNTFAAGWFMMGLLTLSALSPNFHALLALRIAYGAGLAIMMPATGSLLMQWFRPKELPLITGLNLASMSLGMVLSLATAAPLADALGWQKALGVFGGVGLAGACAWVFFGRVNGGAGNVASALTKSEIWAVLRNRTVLLLGAADTACFSMYIALSGWLPTYYNEARGMSLTEAGFIISLLPFMGIFAVLLGGILPLKLGARRVFFIVPGVMAGLGALGSFLVEDTSIIYISVVVLGLGAWLYVPILLTLPMGLPGMTPQRVAITWGWMATLPGIGAFIAPLLVGALRDSYGSFIPGFMIFAVLAWFLVIAGFLLPTAGGEKPLPPGSDAVTTPASE